MIKLLLIDNMPLQGQTMEHILRKHCPEIAYVGQALNGAAGLELAEKYIPDIVFMDVKITGFDGLTLAKKLKKHYPKIQIVIVTTSNRFDLVEKSLRLGVYDYLLKPMSLKDFLAMVDRLTVLIGKSHGKELPDRTAPQQYKELIQTIHSGSSQQATEQLNVLLEQLRKHGDCDINTMRSLFIAIATEITSEGNNTGLKELRAIIYKHLLNDIVTASSTDSLLFSMCQYIEKATMICNRSNTSSGYHIIAQIQGIVEERLHESITLESIANELFFSPSYLSRLFKKQIGKNFSEYLIDRRLERAKLLLRTTGRTVDSIARESGYENANSFRRLFKSKVGISSSEYRSEQHMNRP